MCLTTREYGIKLLNLFCNAYDVSGAIILKFQGCQKDMGEHIIEVNIDGRCIISRRRIRNTPSTPDVCMT